MRHRLALFGQEPKVKPGGNANDKLLPVSAAGSGLRSDDRRHSALRPHPRYSGVKESKRQSVRDSTARLQRAARQRADEEARRIPWQRLYEVRNQYIDWQEFNLWARSILEVEQRIIDWLAEILQNRCPGFLETENALTPKAVKTRPLVMRLEDWIEDHVFGFAKQEGWFDRSGASGPRVFEVDLQRSC